MAEIIEEPTALSKVIALKFKINDVDVPKTTQLPTNKQFNTTDTDAWFTFELDGLASTSGTYDLTLINLDDKSIFRHADLIFPALPFHYKLNSSEDVTLNEIRHAGRWLGQLVVTMSNGDTTARQFGFNIAGHILDGQDAQVILLSDYQALINTINLAKDDLAQYNVDYAALLVDIAAAEDARVTAYNQLLADQQANIEAFDVALDEGIVAANLATKLEDFESTNNSRLLSTERQLADVASDFNSVIANVTVDSEVITARDGKVNLDTRLTDDKAEISGQLADIAQQVPQFKKFKIPTPNGFNWVDNPISDKIYTDFKGNFWTDFDVANYQTTGKTYYVDPVNGVDANDGLTPETALLKVITAFNKADVSVIEILEGVCDGYSIGFTAGGINKNITIKAHNGANVILSKHTQGLVWSLVDGKTKTYTTSRSYVVSFYDGKIIDNNGDFYKLTVVGSIDEVESTPGSVYYATPNIYVHTLDERPADEFIYPYQSGRAFKVVGSNKLYLEGLKIYGGENVILTINSPTSLYPEVYAKDCEFKYATGVGLKLDGAKIVYLQNCITAKNGDDGVSCHKLNGVIANLIEVNCVGRDNGKFNELGNYNNGSTTHDGGMAIRLLGEYFRNFGPNVADANYNTQSWNIGCIAYESLASNVESQSNFTAANTGSTVWLDNCVSYGSTNSISALDGSLLRQRNCILLDGLEQEVGTGIVEKY